MTDFYQVLETSNVLSGVVNIIAGDRDRLTKTLAQHKDVNAVWHSGSARGSYWVGYESIAIMRRMWVGYDLPREVHE